MAKDFNHQQVVEHYDQHIRKLIPGYELIHLLVQSIVQCDLKDKAQAEILVVGCGTGYELQYLSLLFPQSKITAIDPAENMLKQAQAYLTQNAVHHQTQAHIQLIHADSSILKQHLGQFDLAISILVSHFVQPSQKLAFFQDIHFSLKEHGLCLSYDLTQIEHLNQAQILKQMAINTGLFDAQAQAMLNRLEQDFHLVSILELKQLYLDAGFVNVEQFAQVLNYVGILGRKTNLM